MGFLSFLWGKKKGSTSTGTPQPLTLAAKDSYRKQLQRNPGADFQKDFIRRSNLEYELVITYGFEGVQLVFEHRNSSRYYPLGQFPAECPWYALNTVSRQDFIGNNFAPLRSRLPRLIKAMQERILYIYAEQLDDTWQLHYMLRIQLFDNRPYYRVYTGGKPMRDFVPNSALEAYAWELPADLAAFYAVHNGFGEVYDAEFVVSYEKLRVMAETMDEIVEEQGFEQPIDYSFSDLLEFFPDGGGNAQCFYREAGKLIGTVDWDHETWEISEPQPFFEFIDSRIGGLDEE